ncbi:hypothetical protein AgCh_032213 [Apium graveolens]
MSQDDDLTGEEITTQKDNEGILCFASRIWIPNVAELKEEILRDAHNSKYSIHPGSTKMYRDLKENLWWPNMKKEIAEWITSMQALECHNTKGYMEENADQRYIGMKLENARHVIEYESVDIQPDLSFVEQPSALASEIKYDVLEEDNPKNFWEKLTKTYHSKSLANKQFLKKYLFGLKMEDDGDLRDHLNHFNGLINQLNNFDEILMDEDKVVLLLVSLPKKYNIVMTSLLVGKMKLDLDETIVVLLEAERLMKQESSDTSDGSAFVAREDLKELKKNRGGSVSLVEADEDVLLVQEEKGSKEKWVLHSGSSHHICGRREWFSSNKKCEGKMVTLLNGKMVKVAGIGEVTMKCHNGRVQKLTQVRYIPELNQNLILLGKLVDLGYTIMMKNSMLKVTKGDLEILKGRKDKRNLFVLE